VKLNWQRVRETCEELIRGGQIQAATAQLSRINKAKIPRSLRLAFANLCRRARLNSTGLKILWPAVQQKNATAPELAEYAVLLQRVGGTAEAIRILKSTPVDKCAEVSLYQGFIHISEWQYPEARPCLQRYLQISEDPYQRLIAKTNLASVTIGLEQFQESEELLLEILSEARKKGLGRLIGNCHEMLAQVRLFSGDLAEARTQLDHASSVFQENGTWDLYLIRKWKAILQTFDNGSNEDLQQMRTEAQQRTDSETIRELDLFLLKFNYNSDLYSRLTIGTPFPFYRERIRRIAGLEGLPQHHLLGGEATSILDIRTGLLNGELVLNPGKKVHQVLDALTRDLYRPLRVGGLFAILFQNENYDINSSPLRVHQAVRQTRMFLKKHSIPAEIHTEDGLYSLSVGPGFAISLPLEREAVEGMSAQWARLVEGSQNVERVSRTEVMSILGLSESSAQRLIRWAVNSNKIEVDRRQSAQRYKLKVAS
jgi:tetratricopeptide (TPR) repeat protein